MSSSQETSLNEINTLQWVEYRGELLVGKAAEKHLELKKKPAKKELPEECIVYLRYIKKKSDRYSVELPLNCHASFLGESRYKLEYSIPLFVPNQEYHFPGLIDANYDGVLKFTKVYDAAPDNASVIGLSVEAKCMFNLITQILKVAPGAFTIGYPGDAGFTADAKIVQNHYKDICQVIDDFLEEYCNVRFYDIAVFLCPRSSWYKNTDLSPWYEIHTWQRGKFESKMMKSNCRYQLMVLQRERHCIPNSITNYAVPFTIEKVTNTKVPRTWGTIQVGDNETVIPTKEGAVLYVTDPEIFSLYTKSSEDFMQKYNDIVDTYKVFGIVLMNKTIGNRSSKGFGSSDEHENDQEIIYVSQEKRDNFFKGVPNNPFKDCYSD